MGNLPESKKRDFLVQLITMLKQNEQLLVDTGYDPSLKITRLHDGIKAAEEAEARQLELRAASKDATRVASETLNAVYREGSATVDLVSGLLGKDNNLLLEIRKLRRK